MVSGRFSVRTSCAPGRATRAHSPIVRSRSSTLLRPLFETMQSKRRSGKGISSPRASTTRAASRPVVSMRARQRSAARRQGSIPIVRQLRPRRAASTVRGNPVPLPRSSTVMPGRQTTVSSNRNPKGADHAGMSSRMETSPGSSRSKSLNFSMSPACGPRWRLRNRKIRLAQARSRLSRKSRHSSRATAP